MRCRRSRWNRRHTATEESPHELQQRGFEVNHKRVLRMMREDNLLCVRRRAFVVTTDSRHNLPVYPNLAREMTPTAINQLWVADITYIRLRTEFVYLAVVLDAFSRRVIGWALGRTLEAELAVTALRMALMQRQPPPGLVHHSDRGVQYASQAYTEMLKQHRDFEQNTEFCSTAEPGDSGAFEEPDAPFLILPFITFSLGVIGCITAA